MNYIDNYLDNILTKQLKSFEVTDNICKQVTENIKLQMLSLMQYWRDDEFRNTVLSVGSEEGTFYSPKAKIEVKYFVVVTIRNSLLETLASANYASLNAKRMITDSEIREITAGAIEYFSAVDFNRLSDSLDFCNIHNIYKNIREQYPVAWRAISAIGNTKKKCFRYGKVDADSDKELICMINQQDTTLKTVFNKVELSGYDENFDNTLIDALKCAYQAPGFVFYSDSLKMISRNADKLFRVINFLLQNNAKIVTANFYITNGYVEVRRPFIKPAHGTSEINKNLRNYKGMSAKHLSALKQLLKQL